MELANKHVVITGGGGGIGGALARRLAEEGTRAVVVADRDLARAEAVAADFGGLAVEFDAAVDTSRCPYGPSKWTTNPSSVGSTRVTSAGRTTCACV